VVKAATEERIQRLEAHLEQENPALADAVKRFQELDRIARKLGFIEYNESYTTQVTWWPVVAVLGTFSAGKSTFLNEFLGQRLQRTGNQAVDDKFTVISYSKDSESKELPGLALDSDPRFPFYQISDQIEAFAEGEGKRIDAYLALKTTNSEVLRGKIFIDSPGFDADQQRSSTLLITNHIIDLSDLVLVFFDARHPEPGAMADTLKHLVANTVNRADSNKFLYVLNQIDNTAREDNPEEVVAAWQRALAHAGLTAGRFYRIYADNAAVRIDDDQIRQRLESKRDEDLGDIQRRIQQLEIERAYRVIGTLENGGKRIRDILVPRLIEARQAWQSRSRWLNGIVFGGILLAFLYWSMSNSLWSGFSFEPLASVGSTLRLLILAAVIGVLGYLHTSLRRTAGFSILRRLRKQGKKGDEDALTVAKAFEKQIDSFWASFTPGRPTGWNPRIQRKLEGVIASADELIQSLNDQFTSPSGNKLPLNEKQRQRTEAAARTVEKTSTPISKSAAPDAGDTAAQADADAPASTIESGPTKN